MDIRIEDFVARDVVFTRRVGAYEQMAPIAWRTLWSWLRENGHVDAVKRTIGVCWDDPAMAPLTERRYDACAELHNRISADPGYDMGLQTLPGGIYAVHTLTGPYHLIGKTFQDMLGETLAEKGVITDPDRPCFEIYLNDPAQVPERELLTDLCVPVDV